MKKMSKDLFDYLETEMSCQENLLYNLAQERACSQCMLLCSQNILSKDLTEINGSELMLSFQGCRSDLLSGASLHLRWVESTCLHVTGLILLQAVVS